MNRHLSKIPWLAVAASVALSSCATVGQHETAATQPPAHAMPAAKPPTPPAPPSAVSQALLPPVTVNLPGASAAQPEPRFDLTVNNAPARGFFMSLVQGTPYNMVVDPQVKGHISLSLKSVTIPEVMHIVRDVYGYDYRRTPTGYVVLPRQLQTRIFHVNYLDVERIGKSRTRVSSGEVTQSAVNPYGAYGAAQSQTVTGGGYARNPSSSKVVTDTKSDFWKGLKASLDAIVGTKDGRSVVVSAQSGVVVVRAMPNQLREVAHFLKATQNSVERQVILEAKIIEVDLGHGYRAGINWAALMQAGANKSILLGQTGGGGTFFNNFDQTGSFSSLNNGTSEIAGNPGNLNPGAFSPVNGTATQAFGGVFSAALNLHDFNAFIELLKTQGRVHVLSSPRVATVNNQKAIIKVGSDEFFVTNVSTTTVTGTTTTTTPNITLTPFFSGIVLDVTPEISQQGHVILHIHPSVSKVTNNQTTFTVGGQIESLPLAFSTVRESDSIVRALSGQVVVIGGLMQTKLNNANAGVPFLSNLPLFGPLFRQTKQVEEKSELVILLRPVVVSNGQVWNETLNRAAQRFKAMGSDVTLGGDSGVYINPGPPPAH